MRRARAVPLVWGLILLGFGGVVLAISDAEIVRNSELIEVVGQLDSLESVRSRGGGLSVIRFRLNTDPRRFQFGSSSGNIDSVWYALERAGRSEIAVRVDASTSHSPPLDVREFHDAYEIRMNGHPIQTYAETSEALGTKTFLGALLGWISIVAGLVMLGVAYATRQPLVQAS